MLARILVVTDLHKRDVDFSSIKGYCEAVDLVQADILHFIKEEGVTHFISTGDWYDKGYRDVGKVKHHDNIDREIARLVNKNAYICIGNHMFFEKEQNPELYIFQPSKLHHPIIPIFQPEPIFNAVESLRIGNVIIDFFHFDKVNKNYMRPVPDDVTFHIGIYHDDCVVPTNVRERAGYFGTTTNDYLNTIYDNINLAIIGHIHTKIGSESLVLNSGKKVPLLIPGAMAIVQNKDILKHKEVKLPVIDINDDSTVRVRLFPFKTHIDKLKFAQKGEPSKAVVRGDIPEKVSPAEITKMVESADNLIEYLAKIGYGEKFETIIDNAVKGTLDVSTVLAALQRL